MARRSTRRNRISKGFNWKDSYSSLILGAIVIVILGLLVANFLSKKTPEIGTGDQTANTEDSKIAVPEKNTYKIVEGDSLSGISQKFYQTEDLWPVLAKENNIANPNLIFAEATINIPAKAQAEAIRTQSTITSYKVQSGDTLFTIAEKVYGDGSMWTTLDKANNVGRLPNGNPLIFAGNNLVVPR